VTVSIDVSDLLERPGSSRPLHVEEPIDGLATELARVPEDRPVRGDLLLESVVEGVLVRGPLSGVMVVSCARCLKPIEVPFRFDVQELFAIGATGEDDEYPLSEGELDLEPMIRDTVVLSMPFAPLCRPGCLGLCGRCGGDRNLGECTCPPEVDERWSVLTGLDLTDDPGPGSRGPVS
jgi:uncharacterized protein